MSHSDLDELIRLFSKLPGLGPRSARRAVLHLIRHKEPLMSPLATAIARTMETIRTCASCGNLDTHDPCAICTDQRRDVSVICVVEELADLWAIERCSLYKGQYHVLGGTLSALDGRGPAQLNVEPLITRAAADAVKEIILATNATIEGQTTAHYLTTRLE
ncbi:MAG: recombination mediator RecR, partial [Pseudomonadota bacterium]|nr:recombination mediator RecR [Pseudomonadota bacterium]